MFSPAKEEMGSFRTIKNVHTAILYGMLSSNLVKYTIMGSLMSYHGASSKVETILEYEPKLNL
jgi:hypothetical protein